MASKLVLAALFLGCTALVSLTASAATPDSEAKHQSYESCSIIASEYLTIVQLHQKGFTAAQLKKNLPDISKQGSKDIDDLYKLIKRNGLTSVYTDINARYARCAKRVYKLRGKPLPGSLEYHFYYCAGENKLRYQILVAAYLGGTRKEVIPQVPKSRRKVANALFDAFRKKGIDATFDTLATELKHCLNGV